MGPDAFQAHWSVQAVDAEYSASAFAPEQASPVIPIPLPLVELVSARATGTIAGLGPDGRPVLRDTTILLTFEFDPRNHGGGHHNSWVIVHSGDTDLHSRYEVNVEPGFPIRGLATCETPQDTARAVRRAGLVGSPIGFQIQRTVLLDIGGTGYYAFSSPIQGPVHPFFVGDSRFLNEAIAGYEPMLQSGRVFIVSRALDADRGQDECILSGQVARRIVEDWDAGVRTPEVLGLRPLILSFWVNRNPWLDFSPADAWPKPPAWNGGQPSTFSRDAPLRFRLYGVDPDPLETLNPLRIGGPSANAAFRYSLRILGKNSAGRDTTHYLEPQTSKGPVEITVSLATEAPWIVSEALTARIELCDCFQCETLPGSGRCVVYEIPLPVEGSTGALASLAGIETTSEVVRVRWRLGEDSPAEVERRTTSSAWQTVGVATSDGERRVSFEDRDVEPGVRYAYRLVLTSNGQRRFAGEAWTEIPRAAVFELYGMQPQPATANATLSFSLPDDRPATLDWFDAAGRRVASRRVAGGAGRHVIPIGETLAPGIYVVKLTQGGSVRTARAVVMR